MILSLFFKNPSTEINKLADLPFYYYITSVFLLLFFIVCIYYYHKRSKVILPAKFYMRLGYLNKVVPALRKIVTYPSDTIILDFSNVEEMTEGSYMVLLAQAEKSIINGKKIRISSNPPKSNEVINLLRTQKKYLHKNINITNDVIPNAESNQILDPKIVDEIVSELKRIGINEYYQPFYEFLIELIGNATEHGIQHKEINWWLLRYRNAQKKCMTYVFVDMGLGIIKSYNNSGLLRKYMFKDPRQIPIDALYGRLGSSTKEPNRGHGLPQMRKLVEKGYISDFVLITNNVSLQYINEKFIVVKNPNFVGTYFSWTINKDNFIKWKNSKS